VIWIPFDDRFGEVLSRFRERAKDLRRRAKIANHRMEQEHREDSKREFELMQDRQRQQGADQRAILQTVDERLNVQNLLLREGMGELRRVLRDDIASEKRKYLIFIFIFIFILPLIF
jgi:hypothetical protein